MTARTRCRSCNRRPAPAVRALTATLLGPARSRDLHTVDDPDPATLHGLEAVDRAHHQRTFRVVGRLANHGD